MTTISVIICTRNRTADLIGCLQSIARQNRAPSEIIVVDSSNQPVNNHYSFTELFCQERFPKSSLVYMHTEPGLTFQRNRGIEKATGDIIFFFDDDVQLEHDYIAHMVAFFESHPTYAAGMGTVTNKKGYKLNLYRIYRTLFFLPRDAASGKFTLSGMPTHPYGLAHIQDVEILGGCCMAFRNWALEKERFDENLRYYGYMEDVDIAWRLSRNYKLFFNPLARLSHYDSPVHRDKLRNNRAMYLANYSYLFFKQVYPAARWKLLPFTWTLLGLLLEGIVRLNPQVFLGYCDGLGHVWRHAGSIPYSAQPVAVRQEHMQPPVQQDTQHKQLHN